jgi:hypothetical protein
MKQKKQLKGFKLFAALLGELIEGVVLSTINE